MLDWSNITWQNLQKLCLHLAQNIFRDCNFEEYLKEGNDQDGIDLLSIQQPGGKYITIQCKKVESLPESTAKKIIEDFVESYFIRQSSVFILATSTSIGEVAKKYLLKSAKEIRQRFNIELWTWDKGYLEEQLRNEFTLVSTFFSPQAAHEHCFAPSFLPRSAKFDPVKPFIERKITGFQRTENTLFKWWNIKDSTTTLLELITRDRLKAKHICLIGDAYQGKSYLVRQTAYQLQNLSIPFSPLLIELKFQAIEPLEDMLNHYFGVWKNVPAKDTIILIDGMDEVPSEKFYEMLLHIKSFSISHPYITLVFSCRKLFFEHHKVEQVLPNFSTFELYPLTQADIQNFIQEKLQKRSKEFERLVTVNELYNFLYHPFYLVNLVDTFQISPQQLPNSKAGVVEQFIDKSYLEESHRRISGGKALRDKRVMYHQAIQKLAFTLQLAGRNAITEGELQLLFTLEESELLQHNSLITAHLEQWSFANALFQEHLAALALSKMSYEQIVSFISVGKGIKKVKTKWIQTVASLLSLLSENDPLYQALLKFLEEDNIELLFTTEKTKFSESQRTTILKKLLQRCIDKNIRPVLIYESRIALFIDGDKEAVLFLINKFNKADQTSLLKGVICDILSDLSSLLGYENKFYQKALLVLRDEKDPYTTGKVVQVLAKFAIGDKTTANNLVNHSHSNNHDFRKMVYQYLIAKNYVDDYYKYGLDGIQPLIDYNKEISHSGSEYWFVQFLIKTRSSDNLKKLIANLSNDKWLSYFDRHSIRQNEILIEVCKIAISMFINDATIALTMTSFLRNLKRYQYRQVHETILEFFDKTNSHAIAVRLVVDEILKSGDWECIALVREPVFDYLLWEWEEGEYPVYSLRYWIGGLVNYGQHAVAEKLQPLLNAATEGKLNEHVPSKYDEYQKAEQKRRENDIKYIQSLENFKEGVRQFFGAYGKDEIPDDDIYVDFEDKTIRKQADSHFIYRFLVFWIAKEKKAKLSKALKVLDTHGNFDFFRAKAIADYGFHDTKDKESLKDIARQYFEGSIATLDFTNCIKEKGNKVTWLRKQVLIGELFEKFEFDAPAPHLMELVWLDQGGTRNFETADLNKKRSLTQKILAKLKEEDLPYFKQKITDNLKLGISSSGVLGNHIGLCRFLKIFEARDILAEILVSKKGDEVSRIDLLDIYMELGGNLSQILVYFKKFNDFNSYVYFHYVSKFIDNFPKQVHVSLIKCLGAVTVTKENKVRAAQYLCVLGDITGFKFLAEELRQNYKAPYSIQSFSKMAHLNTKEVLNEIKDLGFLLVDPAGTGSHFSESARSILIEWLQIFALKSEDDLYDVIQFYEQTYNYVKDKYPDAKRIFWYEERVIEMFRDTDQTLFAFKEIKPILENIRF